MKTFQSINFLINNIPQFYDVSALFSQSEDVADKDDDDVSAEDFYASLKKTAEDIENLNRCDL